MGYTHVNAHASAILSRHNSERDRQHDALWSDFCKQVRDIAEEEKYKPIILMFSGDDEFDA